MLRLWAECSMKTYSALNVVGVQSELRQDAHSAPRLLHCVHCDGIYIEGKLRKLSFSQKQCWSSWSVGVLECLRQRGRHQHTIH